MGPDLALGANPGMGGKTTEVLEVGARGLRPRIRRRRPRAPIIKHAVAKSCTNRAKTRFPAQRFRCTRREGTAVTLAPRCVAHFTITRCADPARNGPLRAAVSPRFATRATKGASAMRNSNFLKAGLA